MDAECLAQIIVVGIARLAPDISKGMSDPFYAVLGRRMLVGIRTETGDRGLLGTFFTKARRRLMRQRRF